MEQLTLRLNDIRTIKRRRAAGKHNAYKRCFDNKLTSANGGTVGQRRVGRGGESDAQTAVSR